MFFTMGCCDCLPTRFAVISKSLTDTTIVRVGYLKFENTPKNPTINDSLWVGLNLQKQIVGCDTGKAHPTRNCYVTTSGMFSQYSDTIPVVFEKAKIVKVF